MRISSRTDCRHLSRQIPAAGAGRSQRRSSSAISTAFVGTGKDPSRLRLSPSRSTLRARIGGSDARIRRQSRRGALGFTYDDFTPRPASRAQAFSVFRRPARVVLKVDPRSAGGSVPGSGRATLVTELGGTPGARCLRPADQDGAAADRRGWRKFAGVAPRRRAVTLARAADGGTRADRAHRNEAGHALQNGAPAARPAPNAAPSTRFFHSAANAGRGTPWAFFREQPAGRGAGRRRHGRPGAARSAPRGRERQWAERLMRAR